ncbi:MAG: orotate phosphoribosyltransferase [Bacteriovoracaceae bacterium]|nr:orotate phosphoribosyltransferase [Bacteriovoracaceae bacterium]
MLSKIICEKLLEIKAVKLSPHTPFTWASGIKSPIYCDNRQIISYPEIRRLVADSFVTLIKEFYPQAQVIAGTATAGIPHAAWVAERLNLPMIYVRSSSKDHGLKNSVEGRLDKNQKVIVIEDLVSTGGSSLQVVADIQKHGGDVLGVLAIFSYEFTEALQKFKDAQIPLKTLANYPTLLMLAKEKGTISLEEEKTLLKWREDPKNWP